MQPPAPHPAAGRAARRPAVRSRTGALTASATFTLTCTGAGGSAAQSATVTVTSPAPTVTFSASPSTVTSGGTSTLSWTSTNATSCVASGAWSGSEATSGSQSTGALTANASYTLTCTGSGGSAAQSATVTVTTPAPTVTLSASPSTVASGATSTLTLVIDECDLLRGLGRLVGDLRDQRLAIDRRTQGDDHLYVDLYGYRRFGIAKRRGHRDTRNHRNGHTDLGRPDDEHQRHDRHSAIGLHHLLRDVAEFPDAIGGGQRLNDDELHHHRACLGYLVLRGGRRRGGWHAKRDEQYRIENNLTRDEIRDALSRSSYLLETRVDALLKRRGYFVESNANFEGPGTGKSRELDALGARNCGPHHLKPNHPCYVSQLGLRSRISSNRRQSCVLGGDTASVVACHETNLNVLTSSWVYRSIACTLQTISAVHPVQGTAHG